MRALYTLMSMSFIFFATIVTLRVNRDAQRYVIKNYSNEIFHIDVFKYWVQANLKDEKEQLSIAQALIRKQIFSPIYFNAGALMMKNLADKGHAPSQIAYGDVLYISNMKNQSQYYYRLAAAQDYDLAKIRLAQTSTAP